ncbi:MAG: hypothetical protein MUF36_04175 [Bacteroidales bacterium]|nr:hypothetical protein [Bacteroidales bacterium]
MPGSYKLTFQSKVSYLHVVVTGINNKTNVESYLKEVVLECKSRNFRRVLIEEHLDGPRLGAMDVYQIVSDTSCILQGYLKSMAYVDMNAKGDLMDFAETVALNRCAPVAVFSTVSDAEKWLLSKKQ